MREPSAPLVDSGMIQVALALAVVGFLFGETGGSSVIFVIGGLATFGLLIVYMGQWVDRYYLEVDSWRPIYVLGYWIVIVSYLALVAGLAAAFDYAVRLVTWVDLGSLISALIAVVIGVFWVVWRSRSSGRY